jgi:hypothetical protein
MKTTNQKPEEIHLEDAHASLVQAAKIAHLTNSAEANNISKLIDSLEEIINSKTYSIFLDNYHKFVV